MPNLTRLQSTRHRSARRRRWVRYGAAATALLALTSACSEAPAPKPLETAPSSTGTTPTETPSPTGAPTLPPEAKGTSRKAAVAFVRHYVSVLNYAAASLDHSAIEELSAADCEACSAIAESVETVGKNNGRFVGGEWKVIEPRLLPERRRKLAEVQLVVSYPRQLVYESNGAKPLDFEAGQTFYTFVLRKVRGGWVVAAIRGTA